MKTEEDEAFDDLAKRQGAWGGGYQAKRKMAADKLWDKPSVAFDEWWNGDFDESTNPFRLESGAYWAWAGWKAALAQPVQEPFECLDCGSHNVGIPATYDSLLDSVKAPQAQEPVNLLEARKIAAEYKMPDSQVDNGNLYFALSKCLEHIDAQPAQEQALLDAIVGGTGVMLGDKRIDPASIYKQPAQEQWNEDEWRRNNWRCGHGWLRGEQCESCNAAQEPPSEWAGIKAILDEYGLQAIDFVADFKAALKENNNGT